MKRSDLAALLSLTAAPDESLLLPLSLGQKNELVNQLFGDDATVLLRSFRNFGMQAPGPDFTLKLHIPSAWSPAHDAPVAAIAFRNVPRSPCLQQLVVEVDDFVIQPLSRPQAL